jgi:hypothetical protein
MSQDLLDPLHRNDANNEGQLPLPNATAVLVLGILSIAGCILYGVPGLICGIIALALHKKDKTIYETNPALYEMAFKNSKAGFICAIIGVSLSALFFLILIVYVLFALTTVSMFR